PPSSTPPAAPPAALAVPGRWAPGHGGRRGRRRRWRRAGRRGRGRDLRRTPGRGRRGGHAELTAQRLDLRRELVDPRAQGRERRSEPVEPLRRRGGVAVAFRVLATAVRELGGEGVDLGLRALGVLLGLGELGAELEDVLLRRDAGDL